MTRNEPAHSLTVHSPYDRSVIATLQLASWHDAERMLEEAVLAHRERIAPPLLQRVAWVEALAKRIEQEAGDFAKLIAREGGKPLTDAKAEVARAIEGSRLAASMAAEVLCGDKVQLDAASGGKGRTAQTLREPIGVVVAISAFNHPLNLLMHSVVPALLTGCPLIIKPASSTPLNCMRLMELLREIGVPKALAQMILCDNETTERLACDKRTAFVHFVGSAKVGWSLRSKLASGTRCALEHGGVAPVIMLEDADWNAAIPSLLKGGFYHAGQVCVSVQRIFLPKAQAEQAARTLSAKVKALKVGDPQSAETEVGPLIHPKEVVRVGKWIEEAVKLGATLLCGGKPISDTVFAPTVLLNVPQEATISHEEVFAPVVCVYGYATVEEALRLANATDFAFQAAVYGKDKAALERVAKGLDAAAVMINDHTAFRVDHMPFAGRRASGLGMGGMPYTMHEYTQQKMLVW